MSTTRRLKFKKTFKKYSPLKSKWVKFLKHFESYEYYVNDMSVGVSKAFYYYINGIELLDNLDESIELSTVSKDVKQKPTSLIALDSLEISIHRMDTLISHRLEKTKQHMTHFFSSDLNPSKTVVNYRSKSVPLNANYEALMPLERNSPSAQQGMNYRSPATEETYVNYNLFPSLESKDAKQNILNKNFKRRTNEADTKKNILRNILFYFEKYRILLDDISSKDSKILIEIIKQYVYILDFLKPLYSIVNEIHSVLKSKVDTNISLYDYALLYNVLSKFNILKKTLLEQNTLDFVLIAKIIHHIKEIIFELNKGNKTVLYKLLTHFN